jgi:transposase
MIQITPHIKIRVAINPIDFRKGIDGISRSCRDLFEENPFDGAMYIFKNKRSTAVKILIYDGQGFWLCQKRLSRGRFRWWPKLEHEGLSLTPPQANAILSCCDPSNLKVDNFRSIL